MAEITKVEQDLHFRKFRIRAWMQTPWYRGFRWYSCQGYNIENAIQDLRNRFNSAGTVTHYVDCETSLEKVEYR